MTEIEKAAATLQGRLNRYKPNQAVKLVEELCAQLVGDSDSFHGGIWPGNIRLSSNKKAVLGAPSEAPVSQREADEVEFLAPEFFWDGSKSAAADVYSLGLLLYAMCNRGRMPFQPRNKTLTDTDRSAALRRRMKGETVSVTGKLSSGLKEAISKALAYDPEKRYISAAEFLAALEETEEAKAAAADAVSVAEDEAPVEEPSAPAQDEVPVSAEEPEENTPVETPVEEAQEDPLSETPDASADMPELPVNTELLSQEEEAAVTEDPAETPDIRRYTVQKDFEKTVPYRKAPSTTGRRKKRVSPLIPILAILAVGIILVVVLVMALGAVNEPESNLSDSEISQPFTITPSEVESESEVTNPDASGEMEDNAAQNEAEETEEEPAQEHLGSATVNGMDVEPVYDIVLVTESGAKLRTGPSTSYDVADSLPKNTELVRTGTVENWSQVQHNDGEYYIANTLITVSDSVPEAPEESSEEDISDKTSTSESTDSSIGSLVIKTEANVRSGAGTNYDKLGVAKVGTKLTVTDVSSDGKWYQVSFNGKTGYINRNMVTVEELEYSATATVTSDVNVRSGPGSEYTKLGVAKTGDKLTVTGVTGTNWYKISYNGKTGYVAGNYVTVK